MKKFFKALALVLALALVIGVVPAQATSAKFKAKKTLYVGGAKGTSTDGTKKSAYKERIAIYKLAGDTKAIAEEHTYKAVIKSGDSVTKTKKYVYAADLGKSVVEIFKDDKSLGTSVITVKKNATEDTLTITELEDGKEVVCGVEYTVTLPRKGVDTDERRLFVDEKAVEDKEDAPRAYTVKFTKAGDHKVKFEAFQSAELDKATASKEITVKAVMPKPVSAKQVSANSFSVEFEESMEDLITEKDITNQMIYYLIAKEPVVTGVVKSVKVEGKVVTVTMHASLNGNETYYFAYGDAEPISFKTAVNELKYVDRIEIIPEKAYYISTSTAYSYKLYNADGVELDAQKINAPINFTIDSDVAWLETGNKVYFYAEGTATIKASLIIGYDDETNEAHEKTASLTITGIKQTSASVASKKYSFNGDYSKEVHALRVQQLTDYPLSVQYTYSDGNKSPEIKSDGTDFYIQSTDETIVVINAGKIVPVQVGSATIVLYSVGADGLKGNSDDYVVDAFPITIGEKQHGKSATVTLSQNTLNKGAADAVTVDVKGVDLDGQAYDNYKVSWKQIDNNATYTGLDLDPHAASNENGNGTGNDKKVSLPVTVTAPAADKNATVRFTVKVTDNANNDAVLAETTLNLVVGSYAAGNSYKLAANKTALNTSLKEYGDGNYVDTATITLKVVYSVSGLEFNCGTSTWTPAPSNKLSNIPATSAANTPVNYVATAYPSNYAPGFVGGVANTSVTVTNFAFATDLKDDRATAGTYSLSGYRIEYDTAVDEDGDTVTDYYKMSAKKTLGVAQVVVSRSDVAPTVEILNGKAGALGYVAGVDPYFAAPVDGIAAGEYNKIFKVTWEGLNTTSNGTRIIIDPTSLDYAYDTQTHSIFVKTLDVKVSLNKTTNVTSSEFATITVTVNKLFKDE